MGTKVVVPPLFRPSLVGVGGGGVGAAATATAVGVCACVCHFSVWQVGRPTVALLLEEAKVQAGRQASRQAGRQAIKSGQRSLDPSTVVVCA